MAGAVDVRHLQGPLPTVAALNRVVDPLFLDQTEFYKQFKDNTLFRNFVRDLMKQLINNNPNKSP